MHCSDDDLILVFYGDPEAPSSAAAHVAACAECRDRYDDLTASLRMIAFPEVPDRSDRYGIELWHRLAPRLAARQPFWRGAWFRLGSLTQPQALSFAAAAVLLLVVGFAAGRVAPAPASQNAASAAIDAGESRRVLLMSVADHLERSDRVLTDIMNGSVEGDISAEQMWAADLVSDNRFFRQDAAASDEQAVAAVLDELERALLDIVHGPSVATKGDLEALHQRLDSAALLFKLRVLSGDLRDRQLKPDAPSTSQSITSRIS
jgi:hypothetical protein